MVMIVMCLLYFGTLLSVALIRGVSDVNARLKHTVQNEKSQLFLISNPGGDDIILRHTPNRMYLEVFHVAFMHTRLFSVGIFL